MNNLTIKELEAIKLPLVNKFYKDHYPSGKAKKNETIYVAYYQLEIAATVRFRNVERYRLLTGMLVAPNCRGKGIAHDLLNYCHENVLKETDYCFSYQHLTELYRSHGFTSLQPDDLPSQLQQLFIRYSNSGKKITPMQYVSFK